MAVDPVELAAALIRRPSVTPRDAGALDLLQATLEGIAFHCRRLPFGEPGACEADNLYARRGAAEARNFCFAGHTDVVPAGRREDWSSDPFEPVVRDGMLVGRGACDMKGAIAAFVAAAERFFARRGEGEAAVSLLVTGDEEGPAINGTREVLRWLAGRGERLDVCLVGEPTNPTRLGETIKIGRRGSLTAHITVHGRQGHSAYPQLADNPIERLVRLLQRLIRTPLDEGSEHFEPSTVAVTTVDVGNTAGNVIPARARAALNIRFNDRHSGGTLRAHLRRLCDEAGGAVDLDVEVSGEAFLRPPDEFAHLVADAARQVLGQRPAYGTGGGTSDARFIKDVCPVAEFGLVGATMHGVDERVRVDDIRRLAEVYEAVLDRYFGA